VCEELLKWRKGQTSEEIDRRTLEREKERFRQACQLES
jgi:hypothetical protein